LVSLLRVPLAAAFPCVSSARRSPWRCCSRLALPTCWMAGLRAASIRRRRWGR